MTAFDDAVTIVLESEGVFDSDSQDPGGQTYFGIARAFHPDIPWPPTRDQAIAIYRAEYWDAHRCDEMPFRWALALFDGCVNQGSLIVRDAQLALRVVEDGDVGSGTLRAMGSAPDDDYFKFIALRSERYTRDKGFAVYGLGWLVRLARIVMYGERGNALAKPTSSLSSV